MPASRAARASSGEVGARAAWSARPDGCVATYPPAQRRTRGGSPQLLAQPRYLGNVFHQAEVVLKVLQWCAQRGRPPERLFWNMPLLSWPAAVVETVIAPTQLVPANATAYPAQTGDLPCESVLAGSARDAEVLSGSQIHGVALRALGDGGLRAFYDAMRAVVFRRCAPARPIAAARPRAVLMTRGQLSTPRPRNFGNPKAIVRLLTLSLGAGSSEPLVRATPAEGTPLCDQVAQWADADVLLTPTGAHLVNALWMRPGATLVEGVPFAFWRYLGFAMLLQGSGVLHEHVYSARPPTIAAAQYRAIDAVKCAESRQCSSWFRDHSELHLPRSRAELSEADRASKAPASTLADLAALVRRASERTARGAAAARGGRGAGLAASAHRQPMGRTRATARGDASGRPARHQRAGRPKR